MRSLWGRQEERTTHINSPVTIHRPTGGHSCQPCGAEHHTVPYIGETNGAFGNEVSIIPIVLHRDVTVRDSGRIRNGTSIERRMAPNTEMFNLVTVHPCWGWAHQAVQQVSSGGVPGQ